MEARKCPPAVEACPVRQLLARQAEAQANQRQSLNRYLEKTLSDFPPHQQVATSTAPTAGGSCPCVRASRRPSACILEQFVGGGRKQEQRMLVPDLATDWFRKQKVFLDKIGPEEFLQEQDQEDSWIHLDAPEERLAESRCSCPATKRSQGRREGRLQGRPTCGCRSRRSSRSRGKAVPVGDDSQRQWRLGKEIASSRSITQCKPNVAACGPEGSVSRSNSRSRSRAGGQSPPPPPPRRRRHIVRRSSCTCLCRCPSQSLFQSDGQPMSRECQLATRRTEPLMPCLRRKYELREAPQRRLEPQHFRRISPEFFGLLKRYEEAMTESCPLYGISMRHWGESAPYCMCEETNESPEHQQCLGDESVHAAEHAVPSMQQLPPSASIVAQMEYLPVEEQEKAPCGNETCPSRRQEPAAATAPVPERIRFKEKPKETARPRPWPREPQEELQDEPQESPREPEVQQQQQPNRNREPEKKKSGFKCCSCWSKDPLKDDEEPRPKEEKRAKKEKEKKEKPSKNKEKKSKKRAGDLTPTKNPFPAQTFFGGFAGLCRRCLRSGRHLLYSHNSSYQRMRRQHQGNRREAAAPPPIPYHMRGVCGHEPAVWQFEEPRQAEPTAAQPEWQPSEEAPGGSCSTTTLRPSNSCECCSGSSSGSSSSCGPICMRKRSQAGACNIDGSPSSAIWTLQKRSSRPLKRRFVNENFGRRRNEQIKGGADGGGTRLRDEQTSSFVEGFCLKVNKHGTRACYLANDYLQLMKMVARKRARHDCLKTKKTTCRPKPEPSPRPTARARRVSPRSNAAARPPSRPRAPSAVTARQTKPSRDARQSREVRAARQSRAPTDVSDGASSLPEDSASGNCKAKRRKCTNCPRIGARRKRSVPRGNYNSSSPTTSASRSPSPSRMRSPASRNVERRSSASPTRSVRTRRVHKAATQRQERDVEMETATAGHRQVSSSDMKEEYPSIHEQQEHSVAMLNPSNSYPSECLCGKYSYSNAATSGSQPQDFTNWQKQQERAQACPVQCPGWREGEQLEPSVATREDEWLEERPSAAAEHPHEWIPEEKQQEQEEPVLLCDSCHNYDCPFWRTVPEEEGFYSQAGGYDQDDQERPNVEQEQQRSTTKKQLKSLSRSYKLRPPCSGALRWIANGFTSSRRGSHNEAAPRERERGRATAAAAAPQKTRDKGRRYYTETKPNLWYDENAGLKGPMSASIRSSHSRCSIRALSSNTTTIACPCTPTPSIASEEQLVLAMPDARWGNQQQQQPPPQRETQRKAEAPPMKQPQRAAPPMKQPQRETSLRQPQKQTPPMKQPQRDAPPMQMKRELSNPNQNHNEPNRYLPYELQQQQHQQQAAVYGPMMGAPAAGPRPSPAPGAGPINFSMNCGKKIPKLLSNEPLDLKHTLMPRREAKRSPKWMQHNHAPLTLRTARPRAEAYYEGKMRRRCLKFMLSIEQNNPPKSKPSAAATAEQQEHWSVNEAQEQEQQQPAEEQEEEEEEQQEPEPEAEPEPETEPCEEHVWFGEPSYEVDEGPKWNQTRRSVSGSVLHPGMRIEHPLNQWQYPDPHDPYAYRVPAVPYQYTNWETPPHRPRQQPQPQPQPLNNQNYAEPQSQRQRLRQAQEEALRQPQRQPHRQEQRREEHQHQPQPQRQAQRQQRQPQPELQFQPQRQTQPHLHRQPQPQAQILHQRQPQPPTQHENNVAWHWRIPRSVSETRPFYDEEEEQPNNWHKYAPQPPVSCMMPHNGRADRRGSRQRTTQRQGGGAATAGAITAAALGLRGLVEALGGPRCPRKSTASIADESSEREAVTASIQQMDYSKEQLDFTVEPPEATAHRGAAAAAARSYDSWGQRARTCPAAFVARDRRFNSYTQPPPAANDNEGSPCHLSLFAVPTSSGNLAWRATTRARMPGGQEEELQRRQLPPVSIHSDLDFHTHSNINTDERLYGYRAPLPSMATSEDTGVSHCPLPEMKPEPTATRRRFPATPLVIPPTYNALLEEQILQEYLPTPKCRPRPHRA